MSMEFPEPCTGHGGGSDFEPLPKGEYVAQAAGTCRTAQDRKRHGVDAGLENSRGRP